MRRNQIAVLIILLVVLPTLAIRDHSPWLGIARGLGLVGCGILAAWPYRHRNKKLLGIALVVAGCVVGAAVAIFLH